MPRSKIEQRCGCHTNVDNIPAGRHDGTDQNGLNTGAGLSAITSYDQCVFTHLSSDCANRACYTGYYCIGELLLCVTANVIGAKYMLGGSALLVSRNFCFARKKRFECGVV